LVFILHGYADHSEWYHEFALQANKAKYNVYAHDHQGWGKSEGDRGFVADFGFFANDSIQFINMIKSRFKNPLPVHLVGKSMGGLVAIEVAHKEVDLIKDVVLLSPSIDIHPLTRAKFEGYFGNLVELGSKYVPKLPLLPPFGPEQLSRDPNVVNRWKEDPYTLKVGSRCRFIYSIFEHIVDLKHYVGDVTFPVHIFHGTGDTITPHEASENFVKEIKTKTQYKAITLYPGVYHNLLQQSDSHTVIKDVLLWWENMNM